MVMRCRRRTVRRSLFLNGRTLAIDRLPCSLLALTLLATPGLALAGEDAEVCVTDIWNTTRQDIANVRWAPFDRDKEACEDDWQPVPGGEAMPHDSGIPFAAPEGRFCVVADGASGDRYEKRHHSCPSSGPVVLHSIDGTSKQLVIDSDLSELIVTVRAWSRVSLDPNHNLLSAPLPPGGVAHIDWPADAGFLELETESGRRLFHTWFTSKRSVWMVWEKDLYEGAPCRWSVRSSRSADILSIMGSIPGHPLPAEGPGYGGAGLRAGETVDVMVPPGDWTLWLHWRDGKKESVGSASCADGAARTLVLGS